MKNIIIFLVLSLGTAVTLSSSVGATGFEAGRIIDDGVFTNKNSMSPNAIQAFLNSKVAWCDTWGTQTSEYGGGTRRQWAEARGYYPPYTCLKDFSENGKSAAQIIYDVSQEFTINPQVLIVLLQKEQGLVTDTWPVSVQYKTATGYGCPDTAPCDSQYFGLTNQLTWSSRMFRAILNNSPTWYTPYVLGNNYIQYSPDSNCGGSNVYIQNRSTQALYNYTPYQPNQGALNAGWGTAPCGAYGNRNFYLYFSSWFGSTHNTPYAWNYLGQQAYTDQSFNNKLSSPLVIKAGEKIYLTIVAQNSGTVTWKNTGTNPVRVGTSDPQDRQSTFCQDSGWINCSRPTLLSQAEVKPGEIGTFGFWVTAPPQAGTYNESFNLVTEGVTWFNDPGVTAQFNVVDSYKWQPTSATFYKDAQYTQQILNSDLVANSIYYARVTIQNKGNVQWNNTDSNPIRLAPSGPRDRDSSLCSSEWIRCNRITRLKESTVPVGGSGTFEFSIKTPAHAGYLGEQLEIVSEGTRWLDTNYTLWTKINSPSLTWAYSGSQYYTDATKNHPTSIDSIAKYQKVYIKLSVINTGNVAWSNSGANPINLATYGPQDRSSKFYDSTWPTGNRPARLIENNVNPGEIGTFEYWIKAPGIAGNYNEYFNLVSEGKTWMKDMGLLYKITVN